MAVKGRITLFVVEKDGQTINQPDLRGYMDTAKGKFSISLWKEPNDKVTDGYILKGQVTDSNTNKR